MPAVEVVRVYLSEHEGTLERALRCLHDEWPVRGVTVFRGISGFGASGRIHEARWTDLAANLPVVLEFFDAPHAAAAARAALAARIPGSHIVHWHAELDGPAGPAAEPEGN
jgi:hypothetical protein